MKEYCKELIIYEGKLNKQYTQHMDTRLKKVILDPLYMFNYLKSDNDFYKWIMHFREHILNIYNNYILLSDDDIYNLSIILYLYSRVKNQSYDDHNYKKLLKQISINNRLVLFNDRINIKFKELFKNVNINLGFLARDINNEEQLSISISDETENMLDTINKLKKKYYKYKGKYLGIKLSPSI